MEYKLLCSKYKISSVGIGGHYKVMEEGDFEERYANVSTDEIKLRSEIIDKAVGNGINYFDTTWRNEVDMLAKTLKETGLRDKVFVNGMVLGAFRGSKSTGLSLNDYFNKWLDTRLKSMSDNHFNSFMINAIEEDYNDKECEILVDLLEKRQKAGDFDVLGFSCHNHKLAREIADKFPHFKLIMTAYNYKNRSFEEAFEGYVGDASFVAMKPMIWAEYGVPFCSLNDYKNFKEVFGFEKDVHITEKAIGFIKSNPLINVALCSVNSMTELENLISAGSQSYSKSDEEILNKYRNLQEFKKGIPLFIAGTKSDTKNIRKNYFSLTNLARSLNFEIPEFELNKVDTPDVLAMWTGKVFEEARKQGYGQFVDGI